MQTWGQLWPGSPSTAVLGVLRASGLRDTKEADRVLWRLNIGATGRTGVASEGAEAEERGREPSDQGFGRTRASATDSP
eukprot:4388682-Pyramimonas_sp.AAC.1